MAFTNQSPLIPQGGVQSYSNNIPVPPQQQQMSPEQWEYIQQIRRTGYDPTQGYNPQFQIPQQQQQMSDPYTDFANEFKQCSPSVQASIMQDQDFIDSMGECDRQIQAMMEQLVRPQVMQTPQGRVAFEKMLASFRDARDKISKQEAKNMEKIHMMMNDDVIKQRMMEIEGGNNRV